MKAMKWIAIWLPAMIGLAVTAFAQGQPRLAPTTSRAPTKKTVRDAQHRLQVLGYEPGSADGMVGAKSILAVKKFQ
jgi:peptidoglycan hydrolase-like protein with peptidoglycan-binding domain